MSIFFPDNDKRHDRLIQLGADTQGFLTQAKTHYQEFRSLLTQANGRIAAVYQRAGLQAPTMSTVDVLGTQKTLHDIDTDETIVEVSNLIVSVASVVATFAYFAPAATAALVEVGALSAETASAVLLSALGAEVTVGALVGGIVGGLVVGIVAVGIGLAIDVIEGAVERDHLRDGIYHTCQLRASMKLALDKSQLLVDMLRSVLTTCDSLLSSGIPLNDTIISNLVTKNAEPALRKIEAVTKDSVLAELRVLDQSRDAWTNEDLAGSAINLPVSAPIYISAGTTVPERLIPSVPAGLQLTALTDPNHLDLTPDYPVLKVDGITYWPLSYDDNRNGMAIVAFGPDGREVGRWEREGARYIYKLEQDVGTNDIAFVGQEERKIIIRWSDLTNLTLNVGVLVSVRLAPPEPSGLSLAALSNPDTLAPSHAYPILLIGNVRYWAFSYDDNRDGMAIIAYDDQGKLLKRWDRNGARYIWKIEENLGAKVVSFIGQRRNRIDITYWELTSLTLSR
jgi:hypothetical protein